MQLFFSKFYNYALVGGTHGTRMFYFCRLRLERDEALGKAEELDTALVHSKAAGSHSLMSLKENLQKREEEKTTLTKHNKELRVRITEMENNLRLVFSLIANR